MTQSSLWLSLAVFLSACGSGGGVGAACTQNGDCGAPLTCNTNLAGGYCTADCATNPCGAGQTCTPIAGGASCLKNCATPADCRSGYQCFNSVCVPPCAADADCGNPGLQCVSGQCMPFPGAALGAACAADTDCSSRTCFQGKCVASCVRESQCATGTTCTLNATGDAGALTPTTHILPICVARRGTGAPGTACTADAGCDRGSCQYGVCVELCGATPECHGSAMTCAKGLTVFDNFDFAPFQGCLPQTGVLSMESKGGTLPLPSTTQSFAVFVRAPTPNFQNIVGISELSDPAGVRIYTPPANVAEFYALKIRYSPTPSTSTMLVPNSPALTLMPPGLYSAFPFSTKPGTLTSTLFIKVGPAPQTTGTVNLNFYIPNLSGGCRGLTVADAASTLSGAVSQMMQIFGQVGVTIRNVTYQATNAAATVRVQTQPTMPQLPDIDNVLLAATSGQPTTPGFDVVILAGIYDENSNPSSILGVAGGIPSSPVNGTPHSGVVVTLDALCAGGSMLFAATASHELGHSVGLFHSVEQDGHTDPLTDTAADGDTNLMYWLESMIRNPHLSVQQGQVIRNDPKVLP